ncbi:MAG: hypothetical protein HYX65_08875 [Gemmatimonadetes bacterium]|nr:hypothetical protein [Gemmatimonadota bacterium]
MAGATREELAARFWNDRAYMIAMGSSLVFGVCTVAAMLAYPGGTMNDPTTTGYLFGRNFFSDLGVWTAHNGEPNTVSFGLFFAAMSLVGIGLVVFFAAFQRLFTHDATTRRLAVVGSTAGAIAGLCFIGVALTPADLYLQPHIALVKWAFRLFPLAALLYAIAILRTPGYPRRYGWVFVAFSVLLVGYILLLEFGPSPKAAAGLVIQVAGQKVIAYASILGMLVQAYGARGVAMRGMRREVGPTPSVAVAA